MRPLRDQLAGAPPLRMAAHHEGLLDQHAHAVAHLDQLARLRGAERDRLLAEHVLAGARRLDRERHVQVVGQGVVDRLDLGVAHQLGVGAVSLGDAERLGGRLGMGEVARRDRDDRGVRRALHRRDDLLAPDLGRADDAEAYRFHGDLPLPIQLLL